MKNFTGIFLLVVALMFGACNRGAGECETGIARPLDSIFSALFPEGEPGAVVMVMKGDSLIYNRSFGLARLDRRLPMTDSTTLNICSASKTFIVAATLQLVEQGKLSLDAPLSDYLPDYPEVFKHISLRHIFTHTSGLPDLRPSTEAEWREYSAKHKTPFGNPRDYRLYGREDVLTAFLENIDTLAYTPGTHFQYQDLPYLLVPYVIRSVAGERYGEYVKREIFAAAGLKETHYFDPSASYPNMAHGYAPIRPEAEEPRGVWRSEDRRWLEADYGETEFFASRADNGIYTTPREFMHWLRTIHSGKIISRESLNHANTSMVETGSPHISYGLGLYTLDRPGMPHKIFHSDRNGGFASYEGNFPDQEVIYLIFANRPDWERLLTASKVDSLLVEYGWIKPE